ncbi:MAG: TetR/AcrR family transcriptional regulator [Bacteroidales bacterium]|nr:TetR/AcrR family transcriptional regulator [Bacteroidales bacterium]
MGIAERKEREKQQRRKDIIDAAEKVFFSKGIEAATMEEIAEAAELSKGTLYLYFRNKEELQYAIKMRASEILGDQFLNQLDEKSNGIEMVERIGRSFIEFSKEFPDHFNLMMHFEGKNLDNLNMEDPHIQKYFREESPLILFTRVIAKGQQDGSIRNDITAEVLTHNLWAMTTGVLQFLTKQRMVLELCGHPGDVAHYIEGLFSILRSGIAKIRKS